MWHVQLEAERRRAAVTLQCVLGRNKGRQGSFVHWKQNPNKNSEDRLGCDEFLESELEALGLGQQLVPC